MPQNTFPALPLSGWKPTRDTLIAYAKVIGRIRRALTPRQKHWWHVGLKSSATGMTTTPVPAGIHTFEICLNLTDHAVELRSSRGEYWRKPLTGQSVSTFCDDLMEVLSQMGIHPEIDRTLFMDGSALPYDRVAVANYWQAFVQIDSIFRHFAGSLREETGPVTLWPHHFDLALLWFSGRLIPDADPADEEYSDEQMNFGFSTGDESVPEPYFFVTAYPLPDGLLDIALPTDVYWQTEGFTAAILKYSALAEAESPSAKLMHYLQTMQQAGAGLMRE